MARTRSDQPEGLETATDINAETAETLSGPATLPQGPTDGPTDEQPAEDDGEEQRPRFRVLRGIDYPTADGHRDAAPGDEVDDIPDESVDWLLADGIIERI